MKPNLQMINDVERCIYVYVMANGQDVTRSGDALLFFYNFEPFSLWVEKDKVTLKNGNEVSEVEGDFSDIYNQLEEYNPEEYIHVTDMFPLTWQTLLKESFDYFWTVMKKYQ